MLAALGEAGDANGVRGKATGGKKGRGNKNVSNTYLVIPERNR